MPIIPVPPDPTWPQIQAGLIAAGDTSKAATVLARAAQLAARTKNAEAHAHQDDAQAADSNLAEWLSAAKRKATR